LPKYRHEGITKQKSGVKQGQKADPTATHKRKVKAAKTHGTWKPKTEKPI